MEREQLPRRDREVALVARGRVPPAAPLGGIAADRLGLLDHRDAPLAPPRQFTLERGIAGHADTAERELQRDRMDIHPRGIALPHIPVRAHPWEDVLQCPHHLRGIRPIRGRAAIRQKRQARQCRRRRAILCPGAIPATGIRPLGHLRRRQPPQARIDGAARCRRLGPRCDGPAEDRRQRDHDCGSRCPTAC